MIACDAAGMQLAEPRLCIPCLCTSPHNTLRFRLLRAGERLSRGQADRSAAQPPRSTAHQRLGLCASRRCLHSKHHLARSACWNRSAYIGHLHMMVPGDSAWDLPTPTKQAEATCLQDLVAQLLGIGVMRAKAGAAEAAGGGRVKAGASPNNAARPEVVALLQSMSQVAMLMRQLGSYRTKRTP